METQALKERLPAAAPEHDAMTEGVTNLQLPPRRCERARWGPTSHLAMTLVPGRPITHRPSENCRCPVLSGFAFAIGIAGIGLWLAAAWWLRPTIETPGPRDLHRSERRGRGFEDAVDETPAAVGR
jgi:hypothetical protein